jgi:hypothetical protein
VRRHAVVLAVAALSLVGCGGDPDEGLTPQAAGGNTSAAPAESEPSSTGDDVPALVGEWSRTTTCQQRADALEAAGLGRFAAEHAAGDGFVPGVTSVDQLADPKHPCQDAVPQVHSHFFTADGQFGSRDAQGNQVDDGDYELQGDDTVVIGTAPHAVTFHYRIEDGDRLYLDPELPACARKGCWDAQWGVAVAYPGLPWERTG